MRKHFTIWCLLLCILLLTSCGIVDANRIYTVAVIDGDTTYAYNSDNEFICITNGVTRVHSGAGITAAPVLSMLPGKTSYQLSPSDTPCLYKASWDDTKAYMQKLSAEEYSTTSKYLTWSLADIMLESSEYRVRIIWTINGDLRIYAVDKLNNPVVPPYVNEGS